MCEKIFMLQVDKYIGLHTHTHTHTHTQGVQEKCLQKTNEIMPVVKLVPTGRIVLKLEFGAWELE